MNRKILIIVIIMIIASLAITSLAAFNSSAEVASTSEAGSADYIDKYFNKDKVIDIEISIPEQDYQDILDNAEKEEYKQADVVINGKKIENVGFRAKGNSSLSSVARSGSDRFSFKIDFNQFIEGQSLDGLTKLNLNNSFSDPSYMREYLSYSLLKEMNIPTPAYCYANIYINGKNAGLYLAVEGIEESFAERYFGKNYGNLYKPEGTGSDLVYIDDKISSYSGIAAVTKPKNGSEDALIKMIKALNDGTDLDKYINVDEVLRYFAVNTVLVNMDSYQGNFKHNYYLYEKNGMFSILPWDYNMSFGGFGMGGQGGSTTLYIDQPVSGTTMEARPLINKLLEVPEYKELYHKFIQEFIDGPFAQEKMNAEIERVADMIRPYLEKDTTKFYTMEQFEQALKEGSSQQQGQATQNNASTDATASASKATAQNNNAANPGTAANNTAAQQNPGGFDRGQGGADMLQGGNVIGLSKFVQDRIDNLEKQLSGDLPSYGTAAEAQTGGFGGRIQGEGPNGDMPPNMLQMQNRDGVQPPNAPGDFPGNIDDRKNNEASSIVSTAALKQQVYIIAGGGALLLIAVLLILRKKTKYSL